MIKKCFVPFISNMAKSLKNLHTFNEMPFVMSPCVDIKWKRKVNYHVMLRLTTMDPSLGLHHQC